MAASTRFVACQPGAWVSVCQQNDTRDALMIQLPLGSCVLSPNTSGPFVQTNAGLLPCGYLYSPTGFQGPTTFTLTQVANGDMVKQEWFMWIAGVGQELAVWFSSDNLTSGDTIPVFATPETPLWVIVTISTTTGPDPITLTGPVSGVLSPQFTSTVTDGLGDQQQVDIYMFTPSVSETLVVTFAGVTGDHRTALAAGQGVSVDTTGATSAIGTTITAIGGSVPVAAGEYVVVIAQGIGTVTTVAAIGNVGPPTNPLVLNQSSPNGTAWSVVGFQGFTQFPGVPVSITLTMDVALTTAATRIATIVPGASGLPTTVTVSESFALQQQTTQPTMTVQLPQLSREAAAALHELITGKPLPSAVDESVDDSEEKEV